MSKSNAQTTAQPTISYFGTQLTLLSRAQAL
jgi:hypothetical protein